LPEEVAVGDEDPRTRDGDRTAARPNLAGPVGVYVRTRLRARRAEVVVEVAQHGAAALRTRHPHELARLVAANEAEDDPGTAFGRRVVEGRIDRAVQRQ